MQTYNGSGTNNLTGTQLLSPYAQTVTDTDILITYMILQTHTPTACIIYKCINTLCILACYTCALMICMQIHACTHKDVCNQNYTLILKNPFARLFPLARQVAVVHEDIVSVFEDDSCNSKETDVAIYLQQRPMHTCAVTHATLNTDSEQRTHIHSGRSTRGNIQHFQGVREFRLQHNCEYACV